MKLQKTLRSDEGLISLTAAVFVTAFMGVTIVLVSQHQYLSALSEAREVSFNAARAASQQLSESAQRSENQPVVDSIAASQAAAKITSGVAGVELNSVDVDGPVVEVVVTTRVDGALGRRTFTGTAQARAIDPNA